MFKEGVSKLESLSAKNLRLIIATIASGLLALGSMPVIPQEPASATTEGQITTTLCDSEDIPNQPPTLENKENGARLVWSDKETGQTFVVDINLQQLGEYTGLSYQAWVDDKKFDAQDLATLTKSLSEESGEEHAKIYEQIMEALEDCELIRYPDLEYILEALEEELKNLEPNNDEPEQEKTTNKSTSISTL